MATHLLLLLRVAVILPVAEPHARADARKAGAVMVVGGAREAKARARARREAKAKERLEKERIRKAKAKLKGRLLSLLPVRRLGIRPGQSMLPLANPCAGIG